MLNDSTAGLRVYGLEQLIANALTKVYAHRLQETLSVADCLEEANVLFLPTQPSDLKMYFDYRRRPRFPVYRIGVFAACNMPLPPYTACLQRLDALWTTSNYQRQALLKWHRNVAILPPVVAAQNPWPPQKAYETLAKRLPQIADILLKHANLFCFLNVSDATNPAANVARLVWTFKRLRRYYPHTILVQASCRQPAPTATADTTAFIWQDNVLQMYSELQLQPEEITSLYSLAHGYVAPHYQAGFDEALGQAMMLHVPVVATHHPSNLEALQPHNSYLIHGQVCEVAQDGNKSLAIYPLPPLLEKTMMQLVRERRLPLCQQKILAAKQAVLQWQRPTIIPRLDALTGEIAQQLACNAQNFSENW